MQYILGKSNPLNSGEAGSICEPRKGMGKRTNALSA